MPTLRGPVVVTSQTAKRAEHPFLCDGCHDMHRALDEAVRREIRRGGQIRYVQRIYAPDEHRCLCLFEAAGPELVRSVNDIAQFPLARVVAVLSSMAEGTSAMAGLSESGYEQGV